MIFDFEAEAVEEEKSSTTSTIMKVAFFGLLLFGGAFAGYLLLRNSTPQISDAPYDNGLDSAGIPRPSCSHPEFWPAHEQLIKERVLSCEAGMGLIKKANIESAALGLKNVEVKIVPENHCRSDACADLMENQAMISCSGDEPTSLAVFEIGNLARNSAFRSVSKNAREGIIKDRDQYAYEFEHVEYGTVQEHIATVNKCIKEKDWGEKARFYNSIPWKEGWKEISTWDHAENYRRDFDRITAQHLVSRAQPIESQQRRCVFSSIISKLWNSIFS